MLEAKLHRVNFCLRVSGSNDGYAGRLPVNIHRSWLLMTTVKNWSGWTDSPPCVLQQVPYLLGDVKSTRGRFLSREW